MYFRPLLLSDYYFDFLKLNNILSKLPNWRSNYLEFKESWFSMVQNSNHQIFLLIGDNNKIIGTGTIVLEKKMIHNAYCAHLENIIVLPEYQNLGYGKKILNYLENYAKQRDCYKIILNCIPELKNYYMKSGFQNSNKNIQMEKKIKKNIS